MPLPTRPDPQYSATWEKFMKVYILQVYTKTDRQRPSYIQRTVVSTTVPSEDFEIAINDAIIDLNVRSKKDVFEYKLTSVDSILEDGDPELLAIDSGYSVIQRPISVVKRSPKTGKVFSVDTQYCPKTGRELKYFIGVL